MKKTLSPNTVLHPHPVLVVSTYGEDDVPNMMAVSWGGICCSRPPCVAVSLRKATLTYGNLLARKAFTVGVPGTKHVREADFVGLASGRDLDKFGVTGLTAVRSSEVDAPYVDEFPYSLECRLMDHFELGLHTLFVGEIVAIQAEEAVLGEKGLPDIEKVDPIIYGGSGSRDYYRVGDAIAPAFEIGNALKR